MLNIGFFIYGEVLSVPQVVASALFLIGISLIVTPQSQLRLAVSTYAKSL
ncbi:hypothetical protein JYA59_12805 [Vibrio neptunius]|nr:hypothetical protein [Vibrio neptunius]